MSKRLFCFALILVFFTLGLGQAFASSYNIALLDNSRIKVESAQYGDDMRIMVEKGNEKYYYSLNNPKEEIPVQLGKGSYSIKILKNTEGNKYKVLEKSNLKVDSNSQDVYLSSSQPVYWDGSKELAEVKAEILKNLNTNEEKVRAVYDYIVKNIKYDSNKIKTIGTDYVPDIGKILNDKKGICYDYAAVLAGILRSEGIHTKLVKGYKNDMKEYHAWNEVLLDGNWVIIDTTYDAALSRGKGNLNMTKATGEYTKVREY